MGRYARHHTYSYLYEKARFVSHEGYISTKLETKLKHTKLRHVEEGRSKTAWKYEGQKNRCNGSRLMELEAAVGRGK